jgi:hypothetical protein
MAKVLGKDVVSSITGINNDNIISVTDTSECETIDISARGNAGGTNGFKSYAAGYVSQTIEVECLSHSCTVGQQFGDLECISISVNEPLDGPVTYTITFGPGAD